MKKKAAILCAEGLGDSLNMMIAGYALFKHGYQVTTFSNQLPFLHQWLPRDQIFTNKPEKKDFENILSSFDLVVLQHENSDKAKFVKSLAAAKKIKKLITFYHNYRTTKHPPLVPGLDFAFDEKISVADNVASAMQSFLNLPYPSKAIGLIVPTGLQHRRYKKRVILHPTSARDVKNWSRKKFFKLGRQLAHEGFDPWILLPSKERSFWLEAEKYHITLPVITSLEQSASILYESGFFIGNDSGPGHLASYLNIPLITISPFPSISHWQPGWYKSIIIRPNKLCPNIKGLRLKESRWQSFVTVHSVKKAFQKLEQTIEK
jgi:heptosyltransferase III